MEQRVRVLYSAATHEDKPLKQQRVPSCLCASLLTSLMWTCIMQLNILEHLFLPGVNLNQHNVTPHTMLSQSPCLVFSPSSLLFSYFEYLFFFLNDDLWIRSELCVKFTEKQKTIYRHLHATFCHRLFVLPISLCTLCEMNTIIVQIYRSVHNWKWCHTRRQFSHFGHDACWVHWQCDYASHARVNSLKYLHYLTWLSNPVLAIFPTEAST